MKKIIIIVLFLVLLFTYDQNCYTTEVDAKNTGELTDIEKDFFDKQKLKDKFDNEGIMVVDTINNNGDVFEINGHKIEKRAVVQQLFTMKNDKLYIQIEKSKDKISDKEKTKLVKLDTLIKNTKVKYSDIYKFLEENNLYDSNPEFLESILVNEEIIDIREFELMYTYYYYDIYTGYYENYTKTVTNAGIYTIQAEYYLEFSHFYEASSCPNNTKYLTYEYIPAGYIPAGCIVKNNIYTGATRYVLNNYFESYPHLDYIEFSYRSNAALIDNWSSPLADITLIYDYMGIEKMILESSDIGTDYKITREAHYSRNDYNKISTIPVGTMYPTISSLGSAFGDVIGYKLSYFHQILSSNSNNMKYVKEIEYYDVNLQTIVDGSLEIVYEVELNANGDVISSNVDEDPLTIYTFNFGVDSSDPEGNEIIDDAHYIRDVYPYLVWGNNADDYNNYSAFERFVWDKDSGDNFVLGNYEGKNLFGNDLLDLYLDDTIGDAGGTPIPADVVIGNIYFNDTVSPTFDPISTQYITEDIYSNIDWIIKINNESDNSYGIITKFEVYDNVIYSQPGLYTVKVGVQDESGNEMTRIFTVVVRQKVSGC